MVKTDQYNPEEALEFLKRRDVDAGAVLVALREAVIYLMETEIMRKKLLMAWWDSDAANMKKMHEELERETERNGRR